MRAGSFAIPGNTTPSTLMDDIDSMADKSDTADILAPPPLIFIGALAAGYFLSRIFTLGHLPVLLTWSLASPLFLAGLMCAVAAFLAMRRAHTPVDPYESTTTLVTAGPYCFTRNPLCLV